MRKLLFYSLLVLMVGCSDSTPLDLSPDANMTLVVKEAPPWAEIYSFVFTLDPGCPECTPSGARVTPSGVMHLGDGVNGFDLTGGLVGRALVLFPSNAVHGTTRTGRFVATASGHIELTQPAVGTFDCMIRAKDEGYVPPFFLFVETGTWFNCKGSGAFEGKRMVLEYNNAANPGGGPFAAVARIW